jgi:hypothetical protein
MKGIAGLDSANCHASHTAPASAASRREDIRGASSPFLKVFTAESCLVLLFSVEKLIALM